MDLKISSKLVSQKKRQIPSNITHMWNLKYDTSELIYKTETPRQRADLWSPGQWGEKGQERELGLADANYCVENG